MGIFKVWDSKIYDSKDFIRVENKKKKFLEKELKILEEILTGFQTNQFYLECKQKLEKSYAKKKNDIQVRSKCKWYDDGEKSIKFYSKS